MREGPLSEQGDVVVTILVSDIDALEAWERAMSPVFASSVRLSLSRAAPFRAVRDARAEIASAALGFVAASEHAAVEALSAGADEALVLRAYDTTSLGLFVERVRMRARVRQTHEAMQRALAHTEKLAALGVVVAGVAHEINNPASSVILSLEALRRTVVPLADVAATLDALEGRGGGATEGEIAAMVRAAVRGSSNEDISEVFDDIKSAMTTIIDIVRDLRAFSRAAEDEPELVNVHKVINQVLKVIRAELGSHVHVERDFDPAAPVIMMPRSRLVQVVTNVLINAAQAVRESARAVHRIQIATRVSSDGVMITISDTGPGIRPDAMERIFEPFFTTKPANIGTGLGLSVSRQIIRRLGGDLRATSTLGQGATFVIALPTTVAAG